MPAGRYLSYSRTPSTRSPGCRWGQLPGPRPTWADITRAKSSHVYLRWPGSARRRRWFSPAVIRIRGSGCSSVILSISSSRRWRPHSPACWWSSSSPAVVWGRGRASVSPLFMITWRWGSRPVRRWCSSLPQPVYQTITVSQTIKWFMLLVSISYYWNHNTHISDLQKKTLKRKRNKVRCKYRIICEFEYKKLLKYQ